MIPAFRSTKPAHWVSPRPYTDPSLRLLHNGPLVRETRGTIRAVLLIVGTFVAAMLFFIAIGAL